MDLLAAQTWTALVVGSISGKPFTPCLRCLKVAKKTAHQISCLLQLMQGLLGKMLHPRASEQRFFKDIERERQSQLDRIQFDVRVAGQTPVPLA